MQLNERAMLVDLSIGVWSPAREDKQRAAEIADKYGADKKMGKYQRYLIDPDALKPILVKRGEMRNRHYELTLPWGDDSSRIITSAGFMRYRNEMQAYTAQLEPMFRDFIDRYPTLVSEARVLLNGLYDASEYPTMDQLERRFYARIKVKPIPDSGDFRVNLGASEVDAIRQQIESDARSAVTDAMKLTGERIRETVGHMASKLKAYSVTDKGVSGIFRDSLIGNVRDLVDALPGLNIAGDAGLDALIDEMRRDLTAHDADTLRTQDAVRETVAQKADDILGRLAQYGL